MLVLLRVLSPGRDLRGREPYPESLP
jgi:hypothetical protein